ncbi:MAG: transglutaminase domain-containing protein, partial [Dactylosporangium sp.]|nr:transglutaminase domain-containing protein [Dactylosporangium sp.]
MSSRRHLGLVAGAASLLAALPLATVFEEWTWFVRCVFAVAGVTAAAIGARALRVPVWGQAAAMVGALLVMLTFLTKDSGAVLGILPTTETFARFRELLEQARVATREMGVPVSDHDGLLFLSTLGVGGVAICVDLCAVALRRPAVAGLPMLAVYSVPVAVHQDSVSILPFVAGAAGFLWLLMADNIDRVRRFGRRFTGDGRDIDVWEPSPLAAAGRRMAIVGVLVAVALPLAVPGMTTGLL